MEEAKPAETGFFITNENDGAQFTLFNGALLGRTQGDLLLEADLRMSSKHARFTVDEADVFVEDLGSRNGVFVNGVRLETGKPFRIFPGDMIAMGNTTFCLGRLNGTPINAAATSAPKEDTHTYVVEKQKTVTNTSNNEIAAQLMADVKLDPPRRFQMPAIFDTLFLPFSEEVSETINTTVLYLLTIGMAVVYVVIAIKGMDFFVPQQSDLLALGANYPPVTTDKQWWRLFTSAFVHSSLLHLFINQLLIWQAGLAINRVAGGLGLLCIFSVTQIAVGLFCVATQPSVIFVGAGAAVLGLAGAAFASLLIDRELRDHASPVTLTMATLVFLAANLKTGLQVPLDAAGFVVAFAIGFGLRYAVASAIDFDRAEFWKQILRPVGTFAVSIGLLFSVTKFIPKTIDTTDQLGVVLEKTLPVAKSYDELRMKLSSKKMNKVDAFREIERDHLPKLRSFEKEIAALPPFNDERKNAVTQLRSALRAWIESLELQGESITNSDASYADRATQSEQAGFENLAKATESFRAWKAKSQTEMKPGDLSRQPSQVRP